MTDCVAGSASPVTAGFGKIWSDAVSLSGGIAGAGEAMGREGADEVIGGGKVGTGCAAPSDCWVDWSAMPSDEDGTMRARLLGSASNETFAFCRHRHRDAFLFLFDLFGRMVALPVAVLHRTDHLSLPMTIAQS